MKSVEITERDLKEAMAEIEVIRQQKAESFKLPDTLYRLMDQIMGTPASSSRKPGTIHWRDVHALLVKKGWWDGSVDALQQRYRREKRLRAIKGKEA